MATPSRYRNIFNDNPQSGAIESDERLLLHPPMNDSNRHSLPGKPRKIWVSSAKADKIANGIDLRL
jgi:hypothetical protein